MRAYPHVVNKVLAALVCLHLSWPDGPAVAGQGAEVDVAIVFLADMSGSMDGHERRIIREAHANAVVSETVLDAIGDGHFQRVAFSYVEFGSDTNVIVEWWIVDDKASALTFAGAILQTPMRDLGLTGIGNAMEAAEFLLNACPCRPDKRVVDVAADGKNNSPPSVYMARKSQLAMGTTINGLPIDIDPDDEDIIAYFAEEIVGGPAAFNLPVTGIDQLPARVRQKIVLDLY